ncbi:uncharacterized protein LOC120089713 [Benincasa hispida]|uniref:uncharacterized protein LOC120089713 n=1 Tax=Benincasa hispida TaxID=102211 RepID=UPI0018FFD7C1|nr:uncharacterized protein LOC120089713 [Benincasa hispida]
MAQKHLHELLKEDQEPFLLTNFIADRRSLLKRPSLKSHFHLNNPKPISHSSDFPAKFCRSACFFSFNHSPDLINSSPLFGFQSPVKTPCRNPNPIFLHVPARTAGLLLEAALRIQKQSTVARSKSLGKSNGLGVLGSFLKRLTHRGRARKREIDGDGRKNDPRDGPPLPAKMAIEENENENDSVSRLSNVTGFDFCDSNLCDSPFRFVLQSSPSPGHQTPELASPASSPARLDHQANDVEGLKKLPVEDEEEEKEQSSPVSVLDPPFEDDDEGHYEDGEDEDDYNLERSFAIVQQAKHQLLKKLRRFERLAELDPVELETFLLKDEDEDEDEDDDDIDHLKEEEDYKKDIKEHDIEANDSSRFQIPHRPARDMTTLVCNLVTEEERDLVVIEKREEMMKGMYVRSDLWKRVDSNAINVMVGQDLKEEVDGWKRNKEQRREIAIEIEVAIFSLLVEEMQPELH